MFAERVPQKGPIPFGIGPFEDCLSERTLGQKNQSIPGMISSLGIRPAGIIG